MKQVFLALMLIALPVVGFSGFQVYVRSASAATASTGLGDLSPLKTIIADVQTLAAKGDMAAAAKRITDFESAWDEGQTAIRPLNASYWGNIDQASDAALKAVRAPAPVPDTVKTSLATLMAELTDPTKPPQ